MSPESRSHPIKWVIVLNLCIFIERYLPKTKSIISGLLCCETCLVTDANKLQPHCGCYIQKECTVMTDEDKCTDTVVFCGWSYIGFCVQCSLFSASPKGSGFKSLENTYSGDKDQT